jgi:hypothetical protein
VAASGAWLRDRAMLTRYAHVPLAGLGRDALMSIADVLMARRLREAQHVLWAADPALPDLGEHAHTLRTLWVMTPAAPWVQRWQLGSASGQHCCPLPHLLGTAGSVPPTAGIDVQAEELLCSALAPAVINHSALLACLPAARMCRH